MLVIGLAVVAVMEARRGLVERSVAASASGSGRRFRRPRPAPCPAHASSTVCRKSSAATLIYLKTADHYVEAFTTAGSTLVLMRFADAVAELDGAGGLRVHRSYWVARRHVGGRPAPGRPHHAASHRRPRGAGEPHLHGRRPRGGPGVGDGDREQDGRGHGSRRRAALGRRGSATVSMRSMQAAVDAGLRRMALCRRHRQGLRLRTTRAARRAGRTSPSATPRRARPAKARRAFRRALRAWEAAEALGGAYERRPARAQLGLPSEAGAEASAAAMTRSPAPSARSCSAPGGPRRSPVPLISRATRQPRSKRRGRSGRRGSAGAPRTRRRSGARSRRSDVKRETMAPRGRP